MKDAGKKNLLGVNIDAVDYDTAVARIMACAHGRVTCAASALAVHGLMTGALDRTHRYRLNALQLVVPDGQPVRWALNWLHGASLRDRVYGPKLTLLLCEAAAREACPIFFYGSSETVVKSLSDRLRRMYPGLIVAGARPSKFRKLTTAERDDLAAEIRESGAQILFVGLGCPRQEIFAFEMGSQLSMPILAVGAAFDYHSGVLRQPPMFMQRAGLQWLYRLLQEPRRLFRRYLVTNTQFVTLFAAQCLGLWRPSIHDADPPTADLLYG